MSTVAVAVNFLIAAILLWTGVEKLRDRRPIADTIHRLGSPRRGALIAATVLGLVEVGLAIAVVVAPGSTGVSIAVLALAVAFAGAGLVALWHGETIACACFGAGVARTLGVHQIAALVAWLAALGVVRTADFRSRSLTTAAAWFAAVALTIAVMRAMTLWPHLRSARADRLSAQETFVWLR